MFKKIRPLLVLAFLGMLVVTSGWVYFLTRAHSTFDNYYNFRQCQQLILKEDTFATCKLADETVIKIVLIEGKWYLDGDGPGVW